MRDVNGFENNASAVEQRSIARGDPRWLQLVYRNSQVYLDMIRNCPRLLKAVFPMVMMVWLSSVAISLSDFGNRMIDFAKHPSIGGFLGPILSLLGWLVVLQGGFVFLVGVSQAILARSSLSTKTNNQAMEVEPCVGDGGSLAPLIERDGQVTESTDSPVVNGQETTDHPRRPPSRGQTLWVCACLIISQLAVILGFFLPCLLLMDLNKWSGDTEDDFSIFDVLFLLSSLLALVLAMELLAWALFFVLVTVGHIVCDPGTLQPESSTEC